MVSVVCLRKHGFLVLIFKVGFRNKNEGLYFALLQQHTWSLKKSTSKTTKPFRKTGCWLYQKGYGALFADSTTYMMITVEMYCLNPPKDITSCLKHGTKLEGTELASAVAEGISDCFERCSNHVGCKGISLNTNGKRCSLWAHGYTEKEGSSFISGDMECAEQYFGKFTAFFLEFA